MTTMFAIEVRRCFARRLVRWLIAFGVLGCVFAGGIALSASGPSGSPEQFQLADLWRPEGNNILPVAAFFLLMGAVVGGASMIGAEWRAGTFVTLLSWEPNRFRVAVAKILACGVVATGVAVALQIVFAAAFLPATWATGTTDGVDAEWAVSLTWAVLRIAVACGLAAMVMGSIAMIGRNTSAALGVAFGYLMIVENLVRAWKPGTARFLLGWNGAIFVSGTDLETEEFTRSTVTAGATLAAYALVVALLAVLAFRQRDLASAS